MCAYYNSVQSCGPIAFFLTQHKSLCVFPSMEFYDGKLSTNGSIQNRPGHMLLDSFWPKGNENPTMFVDVEGKESKIVSTEVGVDSTYQNEKEAELVVRLTVLPFALQ